MTEMMTNSVSEHLKDGASALCTWEPHFPAQCPARSCPWVSAERRQDQQRRLSPFLPRPVSHTWMGAPALCRQEPRQAHSQVQATRHAQEGVWFRKSPENRVVLEQRAKTGKQLNPFFSSLCSLEKDSRVSCTGVCKRELKTDVGQAIENAVAKR